MLRSWARRKCTSREAAGEEGEEGEPDEVTRSVEGGVVGEVEEEDEDEPSESYAEEASSSDASAPSSCAAAGTGGGARAPSVGGGKSAVKSVTAAAVAPSLMSDLGSIVCVMVRRTAPGIQADWVESGQRARENRERTSARTHIRVPTGP